MLSTKFWVSTFGLFLLFTSCAEDTSKQQEEYQATFQEVLDVHDKLMVRMTDIYEYSKELQEIADTSATPQKYMAAKDRLTAADDDMMNWMEHFGDDFVKNKSKVKEMNPQQLEVQIKAIKEELTEVQDMETEMSASLDNAEELIQKSE
ncbi:MAG: hypothetical protein WA951_05845 [Leeuwenhoekiella sp.]